MMIIMIMEIVIIVFILYLLFLIISVSGNSDENMLSMYECGFDSVMGARVSFSFRFFLISMLFLVFDVEITLLIPLPYVIMGWLQSLGVLIFMTVLLLGLVYEYYNGVLTWVDVSNV